MIIIKIIITFAVIGVIQCSAGETSSVPVQIGRQPYKEVRTKANQDPAVREAIRQRMEREHKAKLEHQKQIEAQVQAAREKEKTNHVAGGGTNFTARLKSSDKGSTNTPSSKGSSPAGK